MPSKTVKTSDYLTSRIKDIRDHLSMNQMYVPWIKLRIGSTSDSGNKPFIIDTSDKGNFFVSMQMIKNGNGYANKATIVLAYIPSAEVGIMDNCGSDINFLDKLLVASYGQEIVLQYGYTYPNIKSCKYSLMLTKTSVEIQNAVLIYTLGATSTACRYINTSISVKPFKNKRPTEVFRLIWETYLKQEGYKLVFDDGVEKSDNIPKDEIPGVDKTTPFQYLQQLLTYATYEKDTKETKDNERSYYTFSISDEKDNKEIRVSRLCQNEKLKTNYDTNIIFDWMNGKDDIVLNFSTEFNSLIASSSPYATEFGKSNRFTLDEQGKAIAYYGKASPESGSKGAEDFNYERSLWARSINTSYKAQLQTIGIPVEFDLTDDTIKVIPLIYGKAHHTQGLYRIVKMTDTIDSSGFTSSFELFKIQSDEVNQLYKDGYDKNAIDKAKAAGVYVDNKSQVVNGTQYGIIAGGSGSGGSGAIYSGNATGQRAKLLQIAAGEMEKNAGGQKFWSFMGFHGRVAWCACFVSWCISQAGLYPGVIGVKSAACIAFRNYFKSKNQWQRGRGFGGNYTPNPGDIVIFNWGGSESGSCNHIGIVKSCDGNTVYTYEGNTSNACHERHYSLSSRKIQGYGVY